MMAQRNRCHSTVAFLVARSFPASCPNSFVGWHLGPARCRTNKEASRATSTPRVPLDRTMARGRGSRQRPTGSCVKLCCSASSVVSCSSWACRACPTTRVAKFLSVAAEASRHCQSWAPGAGRNFDKFLCTSRPGPMLGQWGAQC